ncbi:autotransporter adhesin BpaC-like [Haliotis cracherodii]|uniref:autotransporter adhesin BpaC-like n=1 Tax=Haliotis cracherodii TaxID=6455 RepID=UPI0039E88E4C
MDKLCTFTVYLFLVTCIATTCSAGSQGTTSWKTDIDADGYTIHIYGTMKRCWKVKIIHVNVTILAETTIAKLKWKQNQPVPLIPELNEITSDKCSMKIVHRQTCNMSNYRYLAEYKVMRQLLKRENQTCDIALIQVIFTSEDGNQLNKTCIGPGEFPCSCTTSETKISCQKNCQKEIRCVCEAKSKNCTPTTTLTTPMTNGTTTPDTMTRTSTTSSKPTITTSSGSARDTEVSTTTTDTTASDTATGTTTPVSASGKTSSGTPTGTATSDPASGKTASDGQERSLIGVLIGGLFGGVVTSDTITSTTTTTISSESTIAASSGPASNTAVFTKTTDTTASGTPTGTPTPGPASGKTASDTLTGTASPASGTDTATPGLSSSKTASGTTTDTAFAGRDKQDGSQMGVLVGGVVGGLFGGVVITVVIVFLCRACRSNRRHTEDEDGAGTKESHTYLGLIHTTSSSGKSPPGTNAVTSQVPDLIKVSAVQQASSAPSHVYDDIKEGDDNQFGVDASVCDQGDYVDITDDMTGVGVSSQAQAAPGMAAQGGTLQPAAEYFVLEKDDPIDGDYNKLVRDGATETGTDVQGTYNRLVREGATGTTTDVQGTYNRLGREGATGTTTDVQGTYNRLVKDGATETTTDVQGTYNRLVREGATGTTTDVESTYNRLVREGATETGTDVQGTYNTFGSMAVDNDDNEPAGNNGTAAEYFVLEKPEDTYNKLEGKRSAEEEQEIYTKLGEGTPERVRTS